MSLILTTEQAKSKEMASSSPSASRTVLKKAVVLGGRGGGGGSSSSAAYDSSSIVEDRELHFLFLGCEEGCEYGPYDHTATLFLDLICLALEDYPASRTKEELQSSSSPAVVVIITVKITVYRVSQGDFPASDNFDWDVFDGFILPGSYDAAYDEKNKPWIKQLRELIQTELAAKFRPTLGICFGHQILAHSYGNNDNKHGGRATKCPAGKQVGRKSFEMTNVGRTILHRVRPSTDAGIGEKNPKKRKLSGDASSNHHRDDEGNVEEKKEMDETNSSRNKNGIRENAMIELYYTHGDMVERLPEEAVSLGGNENVPIQAAAYFATAQDAKNFARITIYFD